VTEQLSSFGSTGSNFSEVDKAELEALRLEKDRWNRREEEYRSEKQRLQSQVHELQNQNAQLIEDHTRDVLSVKAKETQLVRARSDAEAAEQMVDRLRRENERLKRELSRAVRAASPVSPEHDTGIYSNGGGGNTYGEHRSIGALGRSASKRVSFASSLSEEKENGPEAGYRVSKIIPPSNGDLSSSGGRGSPTSAGGGEGIESWKRAAEVTSQLKARIEQMKARQGIARHQ
jgi:cytoskeleton-associated protein 5